VKRRGGEGNGILNMALKLIFFGRNENKERGGEGKFQTGPNMEGNKLESLMRFLIVFSVLYVANSDLGVEILAFAFFFSKKAHAFRCSYSCLILFIFIEKYIKFCDSDCDVIDYDSFIQMAFVDIFDYQISYILMQIVLFVRGL
jgi:hypothetical protein